MRWPYELLTLGVKGSEQSGTRTASCQVLLLSTRKLLHQRHHFPSVEMWVRSVQRSTSSLGSPKDIMCAITNDLNTIYLIPVDILGIILYAALPLTVLAEETAKSVHNTWSHLLSRTVNNDLLYNTKVCGANHCICICTHRESLSKRKKTDPYAHLGWLS